MSVSSNVTFDPRQAVIDGLTRRYADRGFWTPKLKDAAPGELSVCDPHRVAFLGLSSILAVAESSARDPTEILREEAQVLGWRFLVYKGNPSEASASVLGGAIAAAHVVVDPKTRGFRLSELNEGIYVEGTRAAFGEVSRAYRERVSSDFVPKRYELLLLIVPAIFFPALWLRRTEEDRDDRDDKPKNDWIFPIAASPRAQSEVKLLDPTMFFNFLRNAKPTEDPAGQ